MSDLLSWLYGSLHALNYTNPLLLYQDISLILKIYPEATLAATPNSTVHLSIPGVKCSFPRNYPQSPPELEPRDRHTPVLADWSRLYSTQVSNANIPPPENRLLKLFLSLSLPQTPPTPSLPPKPAPPQPQHQQHQAQPHAAPPPLPPNPIRTSLLSALSESLNTTLHDTLNGYNAELISTQNRLAREHVMYANFENYVHNLDKNLTANSPILYGTYNETRRMSQAISNFVDDDYNDSKTPLIIPVDDSKATYLDTKFKEASTQDALHLLQLLYSTKKITFQDYVQQTRRLSRNRALLLMELNQVN